MKIGYGKSRVIWYVMLGAAFSVAFMLIHYFLERNAPNLETPFHIATIPIVVIFMALIAYHENLVYRWGSELDRARTKMNELMSEAVARKQWEPVLTSPTLPSCWQELDCDRKSCPAYGVEHIRCWLVAGTFCRGKAQGKFAAKLKDCRECEVYKAATSDPVQEITENFYTMNFMLSERERELLQAYKETHERSEKLAGLVGLSEAALSSMHATELLQNLLESTTSFIGADIGIVYLADRDGEKLHSRVTYGLEPGVADKLTVRASDELIGQAFIGCYIAVSENVADDRRVTNQYLKSLGVRTLINLPLQGMKKMLGILTLGTLTPHHYSEEERDSLYVAADRLAAALESSELASRLGRDQGQLELMAAVSKDPGSMDSMTSIYQSFINHARGMIDFDRASLDIWHPDTEEIEIIVAETKAERSWLSRGVRLPVNSLPYKYVIEKKKPLIRSEINGDEYPADKLLVEEGVRSAMILPLISKGEVLGSVNLGSFETETFSEEDVDLLEPAVWQLGLILDNARLVQEAKSLSMVDGLTGLYNHRSFYEVLMRETERSHRYQRQMSIIMVDIDDFKDFNERYGYIEGDNLLRSIADVIRSEVREIDITARYGGDEFAVLLPEVGIGVSGSGAGEADAMRVADRIHVRVSAKVFKAYAREFPLKMSIGVAELASPTEDATSLLERAGEALLEAKDKGTNQVQIA